jgi:hypothetical protein
MAYSHVTGTDGTITVPTDKHVLKYSVKAESGGTIVITPAGGSAQPTITLDAGDEFKDDFSDAAGVGGGLGPGSTIVLTGTSRYFVRYV